jgi:ferritin-like metal-binding protein YciE
MKKINPSITTLQNLLDYDACKFSHGEIQLINILPFWINQSASKKLKEVLQKYHNHIAQHAQKLERFIIGEGILNLDIRNKVIETFIEEAEEMLDKCTDPEVKDACLLACIQGINHYKISCYGTAAAFAKVLELEKQAEIFHEAEISEKQIDDRLTQLAEFEINVKAKTPIGVE